MKQASRTDVFISYSRKDKQWLERLITMLKPYVEKNGISLWSDQDISSGDRWRGAIADALASAKVAILLVSPDFLASEFIRQHELPALLAAERQGRVSILWIAVRPSDYPVTAIGEFQSLNDPSKPLATISARNRETELLAICSRIKRALYHEGRPTGSKGPRLDGSSAEPQAIVRLVTDLERAGAKRDEAVKKIQQDVQAKIQQPGPVERSVLLTMQAMSNVVEEHLRYDVKLLETIETIQSTGRDPKAYGLPSFVEALQTFKARTARATPMRTSVEGIMNSIEEMISKPIRNIR